MSNLYFAGQDKTALTFAVGLSLGAVICGITILYTGIGSADTADKLLLDLQRKNDSITQVLDRRAVEAYVWEIRAENHKKTADSLQLVVSKYDSLLAVSARKRVDSRTRVKAAGQDELLNRFHELVR